MRLTILATVLTLILAAVPATAKSGHHSSGRVPKTKCLGCVRDSRGKIARSPTARARFRKTHPCPATGHTTGACKGYVIDHIVPLKRGGTDSPSNMQWQTVAAAREKDRRE